MDASALRTSVVIPVYNERWTLSELVRRVYLQSELLHEVIVVDDGSDDGSAEILRGLEKRYGAHKVRLTAVYKERNEGKGSAIRAAAPKVTGDVVLIQDADLEYDPRDYAALLRPIRDGRADVVYGSRFSGAERRTLLFWHTLANRALTFLCDFFCNLNLSDVWTGYKVFRAEILCELPLFSRGFGFEPEVTIKIAKLGYRFFEVPIGYDGRTYAEGKKIGTLDAFTGLLAMVRAWLSTDLGPLAVGEQTLCTISNAERYHRFLYDQSKPFLGREIIETGSGIGNVSRMLLGRDRLVLTDVEPRYLSRLSQIYRDWEGVEVRKLDLFAPDGGAGDLWGRFDTVVCFQVIEHIEDDAGALAAMRRLLKPGGRLVLMVPAHEGLFGSLDKALGHFRRYGREELGKRLTAAGFENDVLRYLNPLAVPGWWLNGRVLGRRVVPSFQLSLFDRLVFLVRWLARFDLPFGLVLFAVGRNPGGDAAERRP